MNEAIRALGQQLDSDDPYERETSTLELAELEDPEAAPFLTHALEDAEASVRRWGAYGLAKLGGSEHVPALRRVLEKDPDLRVRVQAAGGLARLGDKGALEKLSQYLGGPSLEVRRDAAETLLAQPDPAALRPLLKPLLAARDERVRVWAAAVLHTVGEPEAFPKWRSALATLESRIDAVLAVPLMREARAVRELLRLMAEMPSAGFEDSEAAEPSLLSLLADALRLSGVDILLGDADADEALRADLFILLARHPHLIPEHVDDIAEALSQREPEQLGAELAHLLSEQEREERARLFAALAPFFPEAALPTLVELRGPDREAALRAVAQAARDAAGEDRRLVKLSEALKATVYAHYFEGVPTRATSRKPQRPREKDTTAAQTIQEMPAISLPSATVTREMEVPVDDELSRSATQEIQIPDAAFEEEAAEEEEWLPTVPPASDAVAQRALVLGGLLRRLALEERLARGKDPAAKEEIAHLHRWMVAEGFFSTLGVTGLELLESDPGTWSEEDRQSVAWSAEDLHLLLWALKQEKLPPLEARAEAAPLLMRLPLLKNPQPFLESAELRLAEEVAAQRDRWDVLLECARYESLARGIASDPALAEGDPDLELVLESAEEVGFDRKGAAAKLGKARAAVEGLRHWSRHLLSQLQEEGMLPGKPGEGLTFQGKRLHELDEPTLGVLLGLAHGRFQILEWLAEGDAVLPEGEEEAG
ncbi:MAG TPA: HEAT repeat domain-containing protein [Hyalangium sp.]|nr:HEAT repeat domain-containing protein [Hyalangium sp.]